MRQYTHIHIFLIILAYMSLISDFLKVKVSAAIQNRQQSSLLPDEQLTSSDENQIISTLKIPLKRDESLSKKVQIFNYVSQQTAVRLNRSSYSFIQYDPETKETIKLTKTNTPEQSSKFQSFSETQSYQTQKLFLTNNLNTFYTGMIGVADDTPQYKMIFDTGSTLIFLNSIECEDTGCIRGNQYNPKESSTYKEADEEVEVRFGSGTIEGSMGIDSIFIEKTELKRVEFFKITSEVGEIFNQGKFDGIIGLAFPSLTYGVDTLVDYLKEQKKISRKQTNFYLSRVDESEDSFVSFGEIDAELVKDGKIVYHDVSSPAYWTILAQQILLDGEDTGICTKAHPCPLAIDSGTSVIAGPANSVGTLLQFIDDFDLSCAQINQFPSITFVIDGEKYVMTGEEYMLSADGSLPSLYKHSEKPTDCMPGFLQLNISDQKYDDIWIVGDTFISKYYTVFDRKKKRVGFGQLKSVN